MSRMGFHAQQAMPCSAQCRVCNHRRCSFIYRHYRKFRSTDGIVSASILGWKWSILWRAGHHKKRAIKHLVEDEKHRLRRNDATNKWREFWRRLKPATAPIPNETGRVVQLVSIGGGAGIRFPSSLALKPGEHTECIPLCLDVSRFRQPVEGKTKCNVCEHFLSVSDMTVCTPENICSAL